MKNLLAILLCSVLLQSECDAISGGPVFGRGKTPVTGTYAGVLTPRDGTTNALALFTFKIPTSGVGSGTVGVFAYGNFYPGTIQAVADPDSSVVNGVINASFQKTVATRITDTNVQTFVYTYSANGFLVNAKVKSKRSYNSSSLARLKGMADLTFVTGDPNATAGSNSSEPVTFDVIGFKQTS